MDRLSLVQGTRILLREEWVVNYIFRDRANAVFMDGTKTEEVALNIQFECSLIKMSYDCIQPLELIKQHQVE